MIRYDNFYRVIFPNFLSSRMEIELEIKKKLIRTLEQLLIVSRNLQSLGWMYYLTIK